MSTTERLYHLLPAVYRQRDVDEGEPLRALLGILERELRALEGDIETLHDNAFIETCEPWVVPYLADLLGVRGLDDAASAVVSQRARVANTLAYRRRKGTPAALEGLIRDATGWSARGVESFELLAATQHFGHPRPGKGALAQLGPGPLGGPFRAGPFDTAARTAELGRGAANAGRFNLGRVALFVWRLGSFRIARGPASDDPRHKNRWCVHPLGEDMPLFTRPHSAAEIGRASESELPGPIRPKAFHAAVGAYYGPERSLLIYRDGVEVPPSALVESDLSTWLSPPPGRVAIDVVRGRIAFPAGEAPRRLEVTYHYGAAAELGGGPYDRRASLSDPRHFDWHARVGREAFAFTSLQEALAAWETAGRPTGLIRIADSAAYGGLLRLDLPADGELAIEAEDGVRPCLRLLTPWTVSTAGTARLRLDGLLVERGLELEGGVDLHLAHCTLRSGRIRARVGHPDLAVTLERCIVGAVRLPNEGRLEARDSILGPPVGDEPAIAGPSSVVERSTVLGPVTVRQLERASEVIFTSPVEIEHRESGEVRFSYVPPGSRTPRRFRCQPELALAETDGADEALLLARLRPRFTSLRPGDPAFAQLAQSCAPEIRAGAEDDSEMGVFHHLHATQREKNLATVLDEHLPMGLEPTVIFVT